jgi:hypothetical protein
MGATGMAGRGLEEQSSVWYVSHSTAAGQSSAVHGERTHAFLAFLPGHGELASERNAI